MSLKRHNNGHEVRPGVQELRSSPELPVYRGIAAAERIEWAETMAPREWAIYKKAIQAIRAQGVPFLLGGGFALATYTGCWRDTKDIDFYIRQGDRSKVISALTNAGFKDFFDKRPYDRKWIYRSIKSKVIVDIIWAMANQRAQVDDEWFIRSHPVIIRDERLHILPMEEMLWCKLYIMQRDHCDWTDSFNLIHARGQEMDWNHLLNRLGDDQPLLTAILTLYGWLCPNRARELPAALWEKLLLEPPLPDSSCREDRIRLLDSRAWFAALLPKGRKLEV